MMMFLRRRRKGSDMGTCSSFEDVERNCSVEVGGGGGAKDKCYYRNQLEQEVAKLQKQLEEEMNLHIALANATENHTPKSIDSSPDLPHKATELLSSIEALEIAVSKLENELVYLQLKLSQEKNERHLAEYHLVQSQSGSCSSLSCSSSYSWDEQISSIRVARRNRISRSLPSTLRQRHMPSYKAETLDDICSQVSDTQITRQMSGSQAKSRNKEARDCIAVEASDGFDTRNLGMSVEHHPNKLSEEMVRCMRNIFLCISNSSMIPSKSSPSICIPPNRHLPPFSSRRCSDSSIACSPSPSPDISLSGQMFDPYEVHGKVNRAYIGIYSSSIEVTRMAVGNRQMKYAAEALRQFRFLVEQLANVNPTHMSSKEKLAFWINVYNALIMHAFLAYGVPKSDIKLFALMQKASYTVGGSLFNALDIEYILLKMKPPAHRPQMALILALHHQVKLTEKHKKFSVDDPDPLVMFALSCGMHSSPAVKIYTANNVKDELQNSMRDYIQASVGLNNKGKLLVPRLLYCYAKRIVKDSLLVDWISRFLTPEQASFVQGCTPQRRRLLGARSFSVVPFDSSFRYLFLPEK